MSMSEFEARLEKIGEKQVEIVCLQIECNKYVEDAIKSVKQRIADLGYAEGIDRNDMEFSTRKVNGCYFDCVEGYRKTNVTSKITMSCRG